VVAQLIFPGHVPVIIPGIDHVVEPWVRLEDVHYILCRNRGGVPDSLGLLTTLSRGLNPSVLVGDRLQERGVAVGVFRRRVALVISGSIGSLYDSEVESVLKESPALAIAVEYIGGLDFLSEDHTPQLRPPSRVKPDEGRFLTVPSDATRWCV